MGQGRAFKLMICFIVLDTLKLSESLQILVLTKKKLNVLKKREMYSQQQLYGIRILLLEKSA